MPTACRQCAMKLTVGLHNHSRLRECFFTDRSEYTAFSLCSSVRCLQCRLHQLRLDNAFRINTHLPYVDNLQSNRLQKVVPLRLRTFHTAQQGHHCYIHTSNKESRPGLWYNHVIDQELRIALHHCCHLICEDPAAILVVPIMENGAKIVGSCA